MNESFLKQLRAALDEPNLELRKEVLDLLEGVFLNIAITYVESEDMLHALEIAAESFV